LNKGEIMSRITERVARGAALLDAKRPGWASRIDLVALDITSTSNCILGQLYGWYEEGQDALAELDDEGYQISSVGSYEGFSLDHWDEHYDGDMQEVDDLHGAWNDAINERLNV
jgi:hypothetical protein